MKEYSQPQMIKELNTFEKCLLIYSIRKENKELALSLARQIRSECPKENESEIKRLFNIALNLKSIEERQEESKIFHPVKESAKISYKKEMAMDERKAKLDMIRKKRVTLNAPIMDMQCNAMPGIGLFSVDQRTADRINVKAQLFKEEGKSKEFCETQYYNKVYNNSDSKLFVIPNHFFADLAQFWSENDSIKNIGFKTDNILIKPNNLTQIIFMLSVLDMEEKTLSKSQNLIKDK